MRQAVLVVGLSLLSLSTRAETELRVATVVPDGTSWAREIRAFNRDIERRTDGRVRLRVYWGSIAGSDAEVGARIRQGQLDGDLSGGPLCAEAMPSLQVMQFPGLFLSANEVKYVLDHLSGAMAAEAEQAGFTNLGTSPLGSGLYLGRRPISSLAELREMPIWVWDAQTTLVKLTREMGLKVVPAPVDRAAREFDLGHVDSFWAIPTAALAFQWSVRASHIVTFHGEYVVGCLLMSSRAFTKLSPDDQRAIKGAAAQLRDRLDDVSQRDEQALLGGLFQKQGVTVREPDEKFKAEFLAAANAARDRIGALLVPPALLQRVRGLLSDYRAEHNR